MIGWGDDWSDDRHVTARAIAADAIAQDEGLAALTLADELLAACDEVERLRGVAERARRWSRLWHGLAASYRLRLWVQRESNWISHNVSMNRVRAELMGRVQQLADHLLRERRRTARIRAAVDRFVKRTGLTTAPPGIDHVFEAIETEIGDLRARLRVRSG